jgi:hypothetical protein
MPLVGRLLTILIKKTDEKIVFLLLGAGGIETPAYYN